MPGRIFIIDPIVTNRVVLKAQLVAEYFSVDIARDLASAYKQLRKKTPAAIILNFEAEEACGFSTCETLRQDPLLGQIPLVLLCRNIEDSFWQSAYRLGVEEVLPSFSDAKLLGFRLTQIIRRKEQLGEQHSRQHTLIDMGFAEEGLIYPPRKPAPLRVDCTHALRVLAAAGTNGLHQLLQQDFALVELLNQQVKSPVVQIIDETQMGRDKALQCLSALKRARQHGQTVPKLLYIACESNLENHRRILELGADDFLVTPYGGAELAIRLRRLAWLHQVKIQTDSAVDAKLQLALHDEMTGLYNRRYALQYLDNLVKITNPSPVSITVMMLDLDNFKTINDSHGHAVGDAVICETARRLTRNLRGVDLVARVGGEEFLVILRDTSRAQAGQIAQRMRAHIDARPFQAGTPTQHISTSISIGVAHYEANGLSSKDLIQLADDALYQSKGAGRNRVTIIPHAA